MVVNVCSNYMANHDLSIIQRQVLSSDLVTFQLTISFFCQGTKVFRHSVGYISLLLVAEAHVNMNSMGVDKKNFEWRSDMGL